MESKDKEHQQNMELLNEKTKNEILLKQKSNESNIMTDAMGDTFKGLMGELTKDLLQTPEMQEELKRKFLEGMQNNK